MNYVIDKMSISDWEQVRSIYLEGISTGDATFETEAPPWERWDLNHLPVCRFTARVGGEVVGWAVLSPVSNRAVYAGVAEVSIYVAEKCRGRGIGRALLEALVEASEENGIWTLQAGIFIENHSSIALHRRCGFREVGSRERIGKMHGKWRDVLVLERRSKKVGID